MKRRHLVIAVAAVIGAAAGAVPATAAAAATPDAWGQVEAHATRDNYNPGESRLTPAAAASLKPGWSVPLTTARCAEQAAPLVGANRLVTAGAYRISGYDARTGALAWQTPATRRTDITLAAIVGTMLVAESRDCRSGKAFLSARNVVTGEVRYSRRLPETLYFPVVDSGVVVGTIWDAAVSRYATRAYRISDGSPVWRREATVANQIVIAGGIVLLVGDDNDTTAVDVTTGRAVWTAGAGCFTPIGASPDGATFFMRCDPDGRIRRVDAATGAVLRTFPHHGSTSGFATDGERVYLHTFDDETIAVDARSGRRVWTVTSAEQAPNEFAVGGAVVYGWQDARHRLAAFDARTGHPINLGATTLALEGAPMVANGRLYARTASTVLTYAP